MEHRLRQFFFGKPRNLRDPGLFRNVSLVAFLAWVGLGADGLTSSAYGPDEAFRALGEHRYLAILLALATAVTVAVLSIAYSQIIRRFPFGGGGYVVATKFLGPQAGVLSGAALLVDYVLTISVSIAAGADQVFSVLPPEWAAHKLLITTSVIILLTLMNLRGVRESVTLLAPIFLTFLVTHAILIVGGVAFHLGDVPRVVNELSADFEGGLAALGVTGMLAIFLRAYSMGGGTYTGIEAVSNGLQIMREPKVLTGRRTMVLMGLSLALTAGGILVCYLLFDVRPTPGKTMNAVLLESFAGSYQLGGLAIGKGFVILTLAAEAALLFVAAQTGFIDGPRVMANMALDSYWPHRFAALSDRLTMQNGVLLMSAASIATLWYTDGNITQLVTMYAINVFVTFSISQLAMLRYWLKRGGRRSKRRGLLIHSVALLFCLSILVVTIYEKAEEGGWVTLAVTSLLVVGCHLIRRHYLKVQEKLKRLDAIMEGLPVGEPKPRALDAGQPTAVLLVGAYGGLGIHSLLAVQRVFPGQFKNFVFVSVGVIDSASFHGVREVDELRARTEESLRKYVALARGLGLAADSRMVIGTEAIEGAESACLQLGRDYPRAVFFAGKLVFEKEHWFQRLLHNETANAVQRRLQFQGLAAMVMPVRVLESARQE